MPTIVALVLMIIGILLNIIVLIVWVKDEKKYRNTDCHLIMNHYDVIMSHNHPYDVILCLTILHKD